MATINGMPERTRPVYIAIALACAGFITASGEPTARPVVFTLAQAEAGRTAYENSCGKCHTVSLLGRKGEDGEIPPLESLPDPFLKFIGPAKRVPPLIGSGFAIKYGQKTVADMFTLFRGAADTTPVADLHMSDETLVNITAYVLQKNGASAGDQPLTKTNSARFGSTLE
jgi:hypothetical protein